MMKSISTAKMHVIRRFHAYNVSLVSITESGYKNTKSNDNDLQYLLTVERCDSL